MKKPKFKNLDGWYGVFNFDQLVSVHTCRRFAKEWAENWSHLTYNLEKQHLDAMRRYEKTTGLKHIDIRKIKIALAKGKL